MTIAEAMKGEHGLRVEVGSKWLIYDDGEWVVYDRPAYARKNKVLYRGAYERSAVDALLEDVTE